MKTLLTMVLAALAVLALLSGGMAVAQNVDDPADCPAGTFCEDCIRLGGTWNPLCEMPQCGGIFGCDFPTDTTPGATVPETPGPEPTVPAAPVTPTPPATPQPAAPSFTG